METSNASMTGASLVSSIPVLQRTNGRATTSEIPLASDRIESEPTLEYEFSFRWEDGTPSFVTLWDTNDLSACQRASASHVSAEEVTYSKETGNGFFTVNGFTWAFKKEPYQGTWGPHNKVEVQPSEIKPISHKSSPVTADDILASI